LGGTSSFYGSFLRRGENNFGRDNKILLEAGPRNVTTTLVRQQAAKKSVVTIASLDTSENVSEYYSLMKALGQLWLNGIQLDWKAFYEGQERSKLSLPSYTFEKNLLWVNPVISPHSQGHPQLQLKI